MNPDAAFLVVGQVLHERLRPRHNRFVYPVFALRCDVDRLDTLDQFWFGIDRWRPLSLQRRDYGPRDGGALGPWIRRHLAAAGLPADGAIWLQTMPRVFGYAFNPVNFWYCHDRGGALRAVLAEVNNTFGKHHAYLLAAPGGAPIDARSALACRKVLHVSPFCAVRGGYRFRIRDTARTAFTAIDYDDDDGLLIHTTIGGHRLPFTPRNLAGVLLRQPLLTFGVIARIHWQALRLWLRRVPLHRKPAQPPTGLSLPPAGGAAR
jgi:uncharacterized protein